ncbi:SAM-dependent methyltransferase [Nocardia sp. N2S4-5]|uniref:SAM-dependent methyltransferase n=1 Tax=Nocardia sp. N2S4-5 TaxID=3351565 RepID=UPI0037D7E4B9
MEDSLPDLGVDRPQMARIYDRLLGGKDNYWADQHFADRVLSVFPGLRDAVWGNRAFLLRSARHVARAGIDQFLEIGIGIPMWPNVHEVAQEENPGARVVYVDNDPIVLAHARALLVGTRAGRVEVLTADATDPAAVLDSGEVAATLDLSRPVGLSLVELLHFLDGDQVQGIVDGFADRLAPGSYLTLTHATADFAPESMAAAAEVFNREGVWLATRTREEFTRLFGNAELIDPGIVPPHLWCPDASPDHVLDPEPSDDPDAVVPSLSQRRQSWMSSYAGVARIR